MSADRHPAHRTDRYRAADLAARRGAEAGKVYPEFLGGERRCPPEDCGGFPGYYEFLNIIAGPDKGKGSRQK